MSKRRVKGVLAVVLVGSAFATAPAAGRAPRELPNEVQIKDPAGDANALNSYGGRLPIEGDRQTPVDLTVPDILRVWFTHDAKTISAHIQTEAPPPAAEAAYIFRVETSPGKSCIDFVGILEGPTWDADPFAFLWSCRKNKPIDARLMTREAADGTGITTVTVPRSADPGFADGEILKSPYAFTQDFWGNETIGDAHFLVVDDTKPGRDYVIGKRGR